MDPEEKENKKAIDTQRDEDREKRKFSGKLKGTFVVSVVMHAIISMIKILLMK